MDLRRPGQERGAVSTGQGRFLPALRGDATACLDESAPASGSSHDIQLVVRGSNTPSRTAAAFAWESPSLKAALETGDRIFAGFLPFRRVQRPCPDQPRRIVPSAKQFQSQTLLREALSGNRLVFTNIDQQALLNTIALRVVASGNVQARVHPR